MKKRIIFVLALLMFAVPVEADEAELLARIEALELRVSQLEELLGANLCTVEPAETPASSSYGSIELAAGTWVVGEDLPAGKYNLTCSSGSGSVCFYKSLEQKERERFDYDYEYFMGSQEEIDEKAEKYNITNFYTAEVNNIRLEDGNCIYSEAPTIVLTPVG